MEIRAHLHAVRADNTAEIIKQLEGILDQPIRPARHANDQAASEVNLRHALH